VCVCVVCVVCVWCVCGVCVCNLLSVVLYTRIGVVLLSPCQNLKMAAIGRNM